MGPYQLWWWWLIIGFTTLTLEIMKTSFEPGSILFNVTYINWLVFGAYFFALCIAICVLVSMCYPPPSEAQLSGLTFGSISAKQKAENKNSYNWVDIATSILIVAIVLYIMFSFSMLSL